MMMAFDNETKMIVNHPASHVFDIARGDGMKPVRVVATRFWSKRYSGMMQMRSKPNSTGANTNTYGCRAGRQMAARIFANI